MRGTKDFKIEPGVKAPSDVVIRAGVNPNFFTRILPGMFDPLTRGKIAELFGIVSNLTPDDILDGKVVVIDIPIAKYREVGQYAALIWAQLFQRTVDRRGYEVPGGRPVFYGKTRLITSRLSKMHCFKPQRDPRAFP